MRALVTGGTGFVGAAVVRELLKEGAGVSCLVRSTSDLRNLAGLDVTLVQGDLADKASLQQVMTGCQSLYHVAAFYSTRPEDAQRMFEVNVDGTRQVLSVAAEMKVERIVHTSTIGTIGRRADDRLPTEEDEFRDWAAASPYARSKLQAEGVAMEFARQGLPVVVVNPCAPVGPGDIKPSSTGERIIAYLQGRAPSFLAGGINFVGVEDVARGHLLAARRGRIGERYILGHAQGNLTLQDFYTLMEQVSGIAPPRLARPGMLASWRNRVRELTSASRQAPPPAADYRPSALTANPARAVYELGLPQTPLEVAFRQAIVWFRASHYV
jgi:dihydroflavonol-4-reductase